MPLFRCSTAIALLIATACVHGDSLRAEDEKILRAGAYAIDVTPEQFPVLVNGGMYSRTADKVVDRLHARCLVLDDGTNTIAIVVVDSCMVPRDLLDEAKELASKATKIPTEHMLISATHTHSAPAAMGCLGTDRDERYARFLPARIARGIALAHDNLEPARIGWASERDPENVYCRRFLMKEGAARTNPFSGKTNDRAQMNPGHNNPNAIERTGPVDDEVFVLSVQSKDGRPIALLANYSTHYAGAPALSADYFGIFANEMTKHLNAEEATPAFVGMMSNGTSGDANCLDFTRGDRRKFDRFTVAKDTAAVAFKAYENIEYFDWAPIEMAEGLLELKVRVPSEDEVAKAKEFLTTEEGKKLSSVPAVYARETVILSEMPPTRELKLQAIRIGSLGITAIPNEVYGSTGLALKKDSPLKSTFNIELANGAEGYIPPPDQHKLGGYTTWRARTSCLEEEAEPKIRAKLVELLKEVAAKRNDEKQISSAHRKPEAVFRAGAYSIDITPAKFPVVVNGMFTQRSAAKSHGKLHARCLVLDDGKERIAIAVVDSLMLPRELCDEAKRVASKATGIPVERIMISATHTHSAPSVMGCLGSGVDAEYPGHLVPAIARGIEFAAKRLTPAQLGYTVVDAGHLTHCRRWLLRPDSIGGDPYGERTIRAMMHPGYQNPRHVGPAGPVDPDLTLISIQSADGAPLAVLANFSMHYFGSPIVSSDYFGPFCDKLASAISTEESTSPPVCIMSQGTSGDLHWMNYAQPRTSISMQAYAEQLAAIAAKGYAQIEYRSDVSISMAEAKLKLHRRTPDAKRLAWAKQLVEALGDRLPQSRAEIYAREAVFLHEQPERELLLQAIRIGDVGIATFPNEVYGITGLKIKRISPLPCTFNIELANGAEGYIPPPEQHLLGGYTTWPARTAGLEIDAEPKIVSTLLTLLEEVSGEKRRAPPLATSKYQKAVLAANPVGYWPLDDIDAFEVDRPSNKLAAEFDGPSALYLDGVPLDDNNTNRAVQFAGGRLQPQAAKLSDTYSVEFWFENRLPNDLRPVTAYLFSRGPGGDSDCPGDHLGIMGTHQPNRSGRLIVFNGNKLDQVVYGTSIIEPYTWNHVAMVREGERVKVYLNGNLEIDAELPTSIRPDVQEFFFAGRSDNFANLTGKLDEVALFDKALTAEEVATHFTAAGVEVTSHHESNDKGEEAIVPSPVSPEDSLKYLHIRPGMKVELVAAEPLIRDPVAFDWGADGKLWVVEYLDYPTGIDGKGTGGGRIVFLEDENEDGRYDKSTVFMDQLNFPTGVMAWRGGVLITAAPDILFAQDTNDDGKADRVEKLYTGFHEANQQLRVNGLRWGLDGWIYCASGSHHGNYGKESKIKSTKTGEMVHIGARDIRIKPDEGLIEPVSGPSQFGRNRDAWGNWFGCQNAKPMWHYVLEDRYLRRNPHVTYPDSKVLISDVPGQRPVFPKSKPGKFHHASQAGRFTSANSAMIYCDELLGDEFKGNSFVSEPVHNLVHREIVERNGVTFKSYKPKDEEHTEFLASEDTWFRPTTIRTGPDGALWIADMYREIIEHPRWVSDDLKPIVDVRTGTDRGRIYRIYPEGTRPRKIPRLDNLDTKELVAHLESPSATLRDMVQIWIVQEQLEEAWEQLLDQIERCERPETRVQAMFTTDQLGRLSVPWLRHAMEDEHPEVRRKAIVLYESRGRTHPIVPILNLLRNEENQAVRAQALMSFGECKTTIFDSALEFVMESSGDDEFLVSAALSSLDRGGLRAAVSHIVSGERRSIPPARALEGLIDTAIGFGEWPSLIKLMQGLTGESEDGAFDVWQLNGLAHACGELGKPMKPYHPRLDIHDPGGELHERIEKAMRFARRIVESDANTPLRKASIHLIASGGLNDDDLARIGKLLTPNTEAELQTAAIEAIAGSRLGDASEVLLSNWQQFAPDRRAQVLDALMSRIAWSHDLMAAVEHGTVRQSEIDAARRERLLKSKNATIRDRAAKLFVGGVNPDRAKVIAQYEGVLDSKVSTVEFERGKAVFSQRCAACHKLNDVGNEVGPDLKALTDKSPKHLLTSVLDPNRAVEPKYVSYTAITKQGRIYNGMLADESGGSLTLLDGEGKKHVILRRDLDELTASGKSLMPEGLEKDISPEQMRDLLAYLSKALNSN